MAWQGGMNGITYVEREFLKAGGTGNESGDGNLNYRWGKTVATFYDFKIWKTIRATVDYQIISDLA